MKVGDLVVATKDYYTLLKKGETGIIVTAECQKVCIKSGITGLDPEDGGPEYAMEWVYIGLFGVGTQPQERRLDRLSPVKVLV